MATSTSTSRRTKIVVCVFVLVLLAIIPIYGFSTAIIWVGSYDLTVRFNRDKPLPDSIECTTVHRLEEAKGFRECLNDSFERSFFEKDWRSSFIKRFKGEPIILPIQTTGRENHFGRETAWRQKLFLVVVAHWPDGRETLTVADIPDGRTTREMTVSLP